MTIAAPQQQLVPNNGANNILCSSAPSSRPSSSACLDMPFHILCPSNWCNPSTFSPRALKFLSSSSNLPNSSVTVRCHSNSMSNSMMPQKCVLLSKMIPTPQRWDTFLTTIATSLKVPGPFFTAMATFLWVTGIFFAVTDILLTETGTSLTVTGILLTVTGFIFTVPSTVLYILTNRKGVRGSCGTLTFHCYFLINYDRKQQFRTSHKVGN